MKNIAPSFGKAAVLFGLVGMALGLKMGITGDHDHISSHAHINLLGWVSLMLFGLYYKNYPHAGKTKLAKVHLWLSAGGAAFLGLGVFTIDLGNPVAAPMGAAGAVAAILGMIIFAVTVFKASDDD